MQFACFIKKMNVRILTYVFTARTGVYGTVNLHRSTYNTTYVGFVEISATLYSYVIDLLYKNGKWVGITVLLA